MEAKISMVNATARSGTGRRRQVPLDAEVAESKPQFGLSTNWTVLLVTAK